MNKPLKTAVICCSLLALALASGAAVPSRAPAPPDQAEITKAAETFVEAFHKGDAKAVAACWTPDGDYTDLSGRRISGREAIEADFAHLFSENKNMKVRIEVGSVRFPTPDTAIEDGVTSVMAADGGLPNRARYSNFLVKRDGTWLLESVRESPYVPPNNYEHLRQFDWVIGEWAQDVKEGHAGRVVFEWTPDENFIIASRAVAVNDALLFNGSERIGWDPAAKTVRSWSFEADGGFSEGSWSHDGDNKWTIRVSAVLANGSLMTSRTVITRPDPDTVTWQSTEQRLDGKAIADTPVLTMKRVN
jgi:uncharacterized protein (TIGR02246 family)